MAGQFDFQASTSPLLAALTQVPAQQQEARLREEEARRQRLNDLLSNMSQAGTALRQIKAQQLQDQQVQRQMQGQQQLQDIMKEPQQSAPVSSFQFGPQAQQPTFAQTQQGATQPARTNAALLQAFPDQAGAALVKQKFPDEESLALKRLRQQNLGLDVQAKQAGLDPNSSASKAGRKQLEDSLGVKLPDDIPLASVTKLGSMVAQGDRASAFQEANRIRQESLDLQKKKFLVGSTHVGEARIESLKVGQAAHLRKLVNNSYDKTTDTYNIPASLQTELVLGLARLTSPSGQVGIELEKELRTKTAKEGLSKMYTYLTGEVASGPPQDVIKLFVNSIDRQGEQSQENRDVSVANAKEALGDTIDPRLKTINLGVDFKKMLSESEDVKRRNSKTSAGGNGWSDDKEQRYQELLRKRQGSQ